MKKIYLKIVLALYVSLMIFCMFGAISVNAVETSEEEGDLEPAVVGGEHGDQYQYQFQNGYTHKHVYKGIYDHLEHQWQWDCDHCH